VPLNLQELRELIADLNQSDISEFSLKADDFELTVRRGTTVNTVQVVSATAEMIAAPAIAPTPVSPAALESPVPTATPTLPLIDSTLVDVISPMVGTFYRAPGPDEAPFVEVKDRIRVGQTVCIIEAMKLMNEIEAETAGEVVEILIQNGQAVEYGQVLMRVKPN
jgi:acetyl-CoA carboxylase biotin carboxyl carrier protein